MTDIPRRRRAPKTDMAVLLAEMRSHREETLRLLREHRDASAQRIGDLSTKVDTLGTKVDDFSDRLGRAEDTDKGPSGTGLTGRIMGVEKRVEGLLSLKRTGLGAIAGALLVLSVVVLGVKGALASLLGGSLHGH